MIKLNLNNSKCFTKNDLEDKYSERVENIKTSFLNKTCPGNDFLGWLDWPNSPNFYSELEQMHNIYEKWVSLGIDTVVVIGIGGSYIGPKAAINLCSQEYTKPPFNLIFVSGLHTTYNASLLKFLERKNWSIVVISKSGTTFETAVNFRLFREKLLSLYNEQHNERIVAITDQEKGILKKLSTKNNYVTFTIPDDIGGRYSSLTPVGIFPMLLAGLDVVNIINGWSDYIKEYKEKKAIKCDAVLYAASRYHLLSVEDKQVEVFETYENNLRFMAEHYKQIFAESEGKLRTCLIPTLANFSEDLHSIGQLYQQGPRNFFETILMYRSVKGCVEIPKSSFQNDDNLDYLIDKQLFQLNYWLQLSVHKAHNDIPNLIIEMDKCDAYNVGQLFAFFAIAAATSASLLNINPFDQPGVESYKSEMKKIIK